MKKLIFSTLIFVALFSCKKNENVDQSENVTIDSKTVPSSVNSLKEINQDQLINMMASKKNDTIYVINFFATWCGPCMYEIPHFVEKMKELKGKPVKFTFVNVNAKDDWQTSVSDFADEYDLRKNIILFDAYTIAPDYFTKITKTWDGGSIPFTLIKKGDKTDETVGMMSKKELDKKLESFSKKEKTIKLDDDYTVGTINEPVSM